MPAFLVILYTTICIPRGVTKPSVKDLSYIALNDAIFGTSRDIPRIKVSVGFHWVAENIPFPTDETEIF